MEREHHLRALEDSSNAEEMNHHLTIARWLRDFLEVTKEGIIDAANAPAEEPEREDSGSDYIMGSDEIDREIASH